MMRQFSVKSCCEFMLIFICNRFNKHFNVRKHHKFHFGFAITASLLHHFNVKLAIRVVSKFTFRL